MNKVIIALSFFILFTSSTKPKSKAVIIWQPSHQTDTGKDFSEAKTCNGIIEAAMAFKPKLKEYKVWSLNEPNLHHPNVGSNTLIEHTSAIIDGKISGYAFELKEANKRNPDVFIAVHNNGGTKRHAIWGYIHEGDAFEAENKKLASRLVAAICSVTDLENRGVLFDSSTGRNDYVCKNTGKKAFYSLDENVNTAKYRVLLEIGDNGVSKDFLENPANQKKMGEALKTELIKWLEEKEIGKRK
ncbi:N-acetylmuramoyl-L-alanine amidase [Pedobacter sp. Du54]|uniref:N-acetylmuramoyl-L-alanine amidase n=1 Tax=Pedobacter anseongensis TaxID=3133439 RepID=UPI0030978AAC